MHPACNLYWDKGRKKSVRQQRKGKDNFPKDSSNRIYLSAIETASIVKTDRHLLDDGQFILFFCASMSLR